MDAIQSLEGEKKLETLHLFLDVAASPACYQPAHPVVVHQDAQPRLDALHDVFQEMLLHICVLVECQVPDVNGPANLWECHKWEEKPLVFGLLWCTKVKQLREELCCTIPSKT